jgi:hypothetical protein
MKKPLGRLISDLLAMVLRRQRRGGPDAAFTWIAQDMGARVDLADRDVVYAAMDDDDGDGRRGGPSRR